MKKTIAVGASSTTTCIATTLKVRARQIRFVSVQHYIIWLHRSHLQIPIMDVMDPACTHTCCKGIELCCFHPCERLFSSILTRKEWAVSEYR